MVSRPNLWLCCQNRDDDGGSYRQPGCDLFVTFDLRSPRLFKHRSRDFMAFRPQHVPRRREGGPRRYSFVKGKSDEGRRRIVPFVYLP